MRSRCVATAAVAVLAAILAVPARALPPAPLSVTASVGYRYVPGEADLAIPLELVEGGTLIYTNFDPVEWHTITSELLRDGDPAFETELLGPGQYQVVEGAEQLGPGTYPFFCRVHTGMEGVLHVVPGL